MRTRPVISCLAVLIGAAAAPGQPAPPCPPAPCADECPKACLPKPACCLFKKPAVACDTCEKARPAPAPRITVIVPPPEVVVRPAAAPAAAPVCAKGPVCAKCAKAAPRAPVGVPYAAPAPVYAAPPPVLVPQVSYQMMPVVSMQPVPTMSYGFAPPAGCGHPAPGAGAPCAGNQFGLGVSGKDLDAEISRLKTEITALNDKLASEISGVRKDLNDLGVRVATGAQQQRDLEERLKKDRHLKALLEE